VPSGAHPRAHLLYVERLTASRDERVATVVRVLLGAAIRRRRFS
jgi:hypothetical protein